MSVPIPGVPYGFNTATQWWEALERTSLPYIITEPATYGAAAATSYTIPAGAVFVAPGGSDTNPGSQGAPYATLKRAFAQCPSNGTVVIRAGVYHEGGLYPTLGAGPSIANSGVTVQNYPGENVILDGSLPLTGWSTYDTNKWRAPLVLTLDRAPTQTKGETLSSYGSFVVAEYPIAHWPEMVLIDGVQQRQVQTLAEVVPGTFFVEGSYPNASGTDRNAFRSTAYVLGTNPAGKEVRVARLSRAIGSNAQNLTIRGITVRRYATSLCDFGAMYLGGAGLTLENVTIEDISDLGANINGANAVIRHCSVYRCGRQGFNMNSTDNGLIEWNYFEQTNNRRFNYGPSGGAVKLGKTWDAVFRYNRLHDNRGHGVWYDECCYRGEIYGNHFTRNYGVGVVYEISGRAYIVDNIFVDNGINSTDISIRQPHACPPISIISSMNPVVWHNTFINSERHIFWSEGYRKPLNDAGTGWRSTSSGGLSVFGQDKSRSDSFYQSQGFADVWDFYRTEMSWDLENISFGNNALARTAGLNSVQSSHMAYYDENHQKSTINFGALNKANLFTRPDATHPARFVNGWKVTAPGSTSTTVVYFNLTSNASDGSASWATLMGDTKSYFGTVDIVQSATTGRLTTSALALATPDTPPARVTTLRANSPFTQQAFGAGYVGGP